MLHIQSCTRNWKKEAPVYFDVLISTKQEYSSIFLINKQTKIPIKNPTGELLDAAILLTEILDIQVNTAYSTLSKCGWFPAFVHAGKCLHVAVLELVASKTKQ